MVLNTPMRRPKIYSQYLPITASNRSSRFLRWVGMNKSRQSETDQCSFGSWQNLHPTNHQIFTPFPENASGHAKDDAESAIRFIASLCEPASDQWPTQTLVIDCGCIHLHQGNTFRRLRSPRTPFQLLQRSGSGTWAPSVHALRLMSPTYGPGAFHAVAATRAELPTPAKRPNQSRKWPAHAPTSKPWFMGTGT